MKTEQHHHSDKHSRLRHKIALVTGGGRGNGRAIALGVAREGADVALTYVRHVDQAQEVAEAIRGLGRRCLVIEADLSQTAQVARLVDRVCEEFGRIDILVNNAGVVKGTPVLDISEGEWDEVLNVNLRAVFVLSQAVARRMISSGGGSIINISSVQQKLAAPGFAHYCVSKAGLGMLTKALALELARHKIRVNAIGPGTIITDVNREAATRPEWVRAQVERLAAPFLGEPDDLVGAVVFLASEESRLAVGTTIYLDNGKSIW